MPQQNAVDGVACRQQKLILVVLEAAKSKVMVPAGLVSGEGPLLLDSIFSPCPLRVAGVAKVSGLFSLKAQIPKGPTS